MPTAILLDGWQHRRAPVHWQGWLAERLVESGWRADYVTLPAPETPSYDRWMRVVRDAVRRADEPVIVAHGLSVLLWLRMCVERTTGGVVDRALLVAPPGPGRHGGDVSEFVVSSRHREAVLRAHGSRPLMVSSVGDPYLPEGAGLIADAVGADHISVGGGGHLNAGSGFGPWPEALSWCREGVWRAEHEDEEQHDEE